MTILARQTSGQYRIEPYCRRWRPVPEHLYGRTRLTCTRHRGHWQAHHNQRTGWGWLADRAPFRTWICNGHLDEHHPHGATLEGATYDEARTRGWRILLDRGRIDAMCPACARPDPVTAGLCRDLERSIGR